MANLPYIALLSLITLFFVYKSFALVTENGTDLIHEACNNTRKYSLCVSALESDPRSLVAPNLFALVKVSLDILKANVTDAHSFVSVLLKNETDERMKRCLQEACLVEYDVALSYIDRAFDYLKSNDYRSLNINIAAVDDSVETCRVCLSPKFQARASSLINRCEIISYLSDIPGTISDSLLQFCLSHPSHPSCIREDHWA
ncbi:pectinesterase inhibitor-like [Tasmannia lanceolata]|uniref:pectinesterase inhibitor-like n=1 Tax=Tasmannia lanceolata TaxID=3420 RepID=UPI004063E667